MPALKPISREYRMYLALWRKAYQSPEPLLFKVPNFAKGVAVRQGMYRAIKPFRLGELEDKELRAAAEGFVVHLLKTLNDKGKHQPDKIHWIEIVPRPALAVMDDVFEEFELNDNDLLIGEEREISDKLKTLVKETSKPKPKGKATPFYERED